MLKKGVLGTVKEVHVWTNRPVWPQGIDRGTPKPVPEHLEWDLWLSVAPDRPYADNYHDFKWRGWWDFGTGALGDMACHTVNMPFMGLDLANPTSVKAITAGHNKDSYPAWSLIDFKFPANDNRPEIAFKWYDGGKKPDVSILDGLRDKMPGSGCVIVGEKGKMFSPDDYGSQYFLTEGVEEPDVEYPRSPGHFQEWVAAIKGGPEAMSNFADYAGPLTETILLGNLAVWCAAEKNDGDQAVGEEVLWDAKTMTVKNIEGLESIVKPTYREGYVLDA